MSITKVSTAAAIIVAIAAVGTIAFAARGMSANAAIEQHPPESLARYFTQRDRARAAQFCGVGSNGNSNVAAAYAWRHPQTGEISCAAVCAVEKDGVPARRADWECGK